MENQKKLIESPLGGEAAPLMIPMVTSASLDQNEGTQVELCADGGVFRKMSEIKVKPIEWVIPGVVPRGELTLLGGDGGVGKGLYLAQMIAYVTTDETSGFFPDRPTNTGTVIIFSGEDQMSHVWRRQERTLKRSGQSIWEPIGQRLVRCHTLTIPQH